MSDYDVNDYLEAFATRDDDGHYYEKDWYRLLHTFQLSEEALEQPKYISTEAYEAWKADLELSCRDLSSCLGFELRSGPLGPYSVSLDIDRTQNTLTFYVTSLVDEPEKTTEIEVDATPIIDDLNSYREYYLAKIPNNTSESALEAFDRARKFEHHRGTEIISGLLKERGIDTTIDNFSRKFFDLLQIAMTMPSDQAKRLNAIYSPHRG